MPSRKQRPGEKSPSVQENDGLAGAAEYLQNVSCFSRLRSSGKWPDWTSWTKESRVTAGQKLAVEIMSIAGGQGAAGESSSLPVSGEADPGFAEAVDRLAQSLAFDRLAESDSFESGAPVVSGVNITADFMGKRTELRASDGRQVQARWAIVDADSVLLPRRADGSAVPAFSDPDMPKNVIRIAAGGRRAAAISKAYDEGCAADYWKGLYRSAGQYGLIRNCALDVLKPMLVRVVLPSGYVDPDEALASFAGLGLEPRLCKAIADSCHVDTACLEVDQDGYFTDEAMREFAKIIPRSTAHDLLDEEGEPTQRCEKRLCNAAFLHAYGVDPEGDRLTGLGLAVQMLRVSLTRGADQHDRNVVCTLRLAAPAVQKMSGMPAEYDLRAEVSEAARLAMTSTMGRISAPEDFALLASRQPRTDLIRILRSCDEDPELAAERLVRFAQRVCASGRDAFV